MTNRDRRALSKVAWVDARTSWWRSSDRASYPNDRRRESRATRGSRAQDSFRWKAYLALERPRLWFSRRAFVPPLWVPSASAKSAGIRHPCRRCEAERRIRIRRRPEAKPRWFARADVVFETTLLLPQTRSIPSGA